MSGMRLDDQFAVEPQVEPQNAVRRRVLRTHRQRHLRLERRVERSSTPAGIFSTAVLMFVNRLVIRDSASINDSRFRSLVHAVRLVAAQRIILSQCVAVKIGRQKNTAQVRMSVKNDAEQS